MRRRVRVGVPAAVVVAALTLTGCTDGADPEAAARSSTPTPTASPTPPPTAVRAPAPSSGVCYDLPFDEATSPTTAAEARPCGGPHTAETFAVGTVDNLLDGHLLAVDSQRVQDDVATRCPARLPEMVGGDAETRRLSMLRAVWFTPSLEESAAGADWYRCDVVALAGGDELATVRGSLEGVLDTEEGRERWGMCGTAGPDDADFMRVPCSQPHSWRAFSVVELPDGAYPGQQLIRDAASGPCEDAGASVADDPLDYQWGFEGPDPDQWRLGQTFARCWAPD